MKSKTTKQKKSNILLFFIGTILVLIFAVWGPEYLADYSDRATLNHVTAEPAENVGEGYRYALSSNARIYILSKCLNSQSQLDNELSGQRDMGNVNYEELTGTYAFVVNKQGPSEREITQEDIYRVCNEELAKLREQGVLPDEVKEVAAANYNAVLYSAIDVLEPRNNVAVWKVSLSTDKQNADKAGRLLDAYLDAETGKLYEFYVRTKTTWDGLAPDAMVEAWAEYMELSGQEDYESENPLLENTPYYQKYRFAGVDEGSTVVTIGFYEGINELYLKISR